MICPSNGVKTFRETRSAVGRFLDNPGAGPVQPTFGDMLINKLCWDIVGAELTEYRNRQYKSQINEKKLRMSEAGLCIFP